MTDSKPFSLRVARRVLTPFQRLIHGLKKKWFGIPDYQWEDFKYSRKLKAEAYTAAQIQEIRKECELFKYRPKLSVVVTVYNIEREYLERAILSVTQQYYSNWELCMVDDASPSGHIREVLNEFEKKDDRIRVKYLQKNLGMAGAANEGLAMAQGEYVVLLDHDDELSLDCLYEVAKLLNRFPDAEIIYSDEDKLTMDHRRLRPVIKPDWDAQLFLTYNYLCHVVVCKRELIMRAGGFRRGFEGSQDYDMLLRTTEMTQGIYHIPKVLYHWRMIPGSAALVVDAKKEAFEKSKQALRDAMTRRGIKADVIDGTTIGTFKVLA